MLLEVTAWSLVWCFYVELFKKVRDCIKSHVTEEAVGVCMLWPILFQRAKSLLTFSSIEMRHHQMEVMHEGSQA